MPSLFSRNDMVLFGHRLVKQHGPTLASVLLEWAARPDQLCPVMGVGSLLWKSDPSVPLATHVLPVHGREPDWPRLEILFKRVRVLNEDRLSLHYLICLFESRATSLRVATRFPRKHIEAFQAAKKIFPENVAIEDFKPWNNATESATNQDSSASSIDPLDYLKLHGLDDYKHWFTVHDLESSFVVVRSRWRPEPNRF